MLAKVSLLAGLGFVSASNIADFSPNWCGSHPSSLGKDEAANQLAIQQSISAQPEFRLDSIKETKVDVYIHIIGNTTAETRHLMNDTIVKKQMEVLNKGHRKSRTGFSFYAKSIKRYADPVGASWTPDRDFPYETRVGTKRDLNLYYLTNMPPDGPGGVGNFPWLTNHTSFADDIIRISTNLVPGGASKAHNSGDVTTHEVGHWLGLFHTFQFGCEGGDYVDDTPPQKDPSVGCPIGKDSCDQPGLDPVENFMDYSTCLREFTPGQVARMHAMWNKYRA